MKMKLQEVHPALVHFPLTLLPLAIGADLVGRVARRKQLSALGRWGIAAAAGTGLVAGLFGLVAQQEVKAEGKSLDMLITHRDLNLGAVAVMTAMAVRRSRREKAGLAYLGVGLATMGAVGYSAYLGGHMVYTDGVGVEKAGGVAGGVPAIGRDSAGRIAARTARDLGAGVLTTAKELARGKVVPTLVSRAGAHA